MNNMVQGFLDNDSFFGRFMTKLGIRSEGVVNPFKEFWTGLRVNFKQATISWILFVLLIAFVLMDIRICNAAGGALGYLKIGAYAIGAAAIILYLYLIPVMTVFEDSLPHLIRNAFYFLWKKPWKTLVILFFDIFPFVLTFTDLQTLPLYAFLWVMCGFGLQAMLAATLLLPEFEPYLAVKEETEEPLEELEANKEVEEEILEEMKKLGM